MTITTTSGPEDRLPRGPARQPHKTQELIHHDNMSGCIKPLCKVVFFSHRWEESDDKTWNVAVEEAGFVRMHTGLLWEPPEFLISVLSWGANFHKYKNRRESMSRFPPSQQFFIVDAVLVTEWVNTLGQKRNKAKQPATIAILLWNHFKNKISLTYSVTKIGLFFTNIGP